MNDAIVRTLAPWLLKVRPAQLGSALKWLFRVKRLEVELEELTFWIDPASVLGHILLNEGSYERHVSRLLRRLLRPGDVFLDVGANEGYFSVLASRLVDGRGGDVHAIEPQSRLHQVLERNMQLNGCSINLHRIALTDKEGFTTLHLRPSTNTGASSLFRHWNLGWTRESVPTMTLDHFFDEMSLDRARLMKLDCEGAESLVMRGAKRVLSESRIDYIAIDYHTQITGWDMAEETHKRILDAGYFAQMWQGVTLYHLPELADALQTC